MYKEVAFDPECLSEYHYYGLLKGQFGFETGRYVIAPVKEWAREAFQAVKASNQLQPVKKKSVTTFLNRLQKSKNCGLICLPEDRREIKAQPWIDWLKAQTQYRDFSAVISERVGEAISYDDTIDAHPNWVVPPSTIIEKKAQNIADAVAPLLKLGSELFIVDQYFKLAGNRALMAILSELQKYCTVNKLTLVTSIDTADPFTVFNTEIAPEFDFLPTFTLIVAPEKYFHDRYMLSELGALKSGQGFSEGVERGIQADNLSFNLCGISESKDTKTWIKKVIAEGKATEFLLHHQ